MATFGKTDEGGSTGNYYGQLRGWKGNVAEGGTITQVSVYLTWSTYVRVGIYQGSDPSTAELLWESDSIPHSGADWEHISVPNVTFDSGGMILAVAHSENNSRVKYDTVSGGGIAKSWTYGSMPDPLDASTSTVQLSVYATYTPSVSSYTKTYSADALFKKLGVTKSLGADAAFQKRDIEKTADIDALLKALDIQKTAQVDALFKKLDLLEAFGVDVTLLKKDIIKSFGVDAKFGAAVTETISKQIDVLLKKLDAKKTFGLEVYFGQVEGETYAKNLALDVIFAYKVRLPELWLDENGKLVLNVSKPYTWVGT